MNSKIVSLFIAFFSLMLMLPSSSNAVELYSFFDNSCKETKGYLVAERNNIYDILSVEGRVISLKKDNIRGVLVYNFVNPPIRKIKLNNIEIQKDIKTLFVSDEAGKESVFSGFPLQFIEDLIIFLGVDGSVRIHKLDSILKIRPYDMTLSSRPLKKKRKKKGLDLDIHSRGYVQSCESSGDKGFTKPSRILVDRIKIQQFLSGFKVGYENLTSFQERTYLYARPKLYTQKTRFGILNQKPVEMSSSANGDLNETAPFIEWSSGKPFRVQSLTQLGAVYNEFGADLDPLLGFKTELKAHFFHAVFTGNFEGMAAGDDFLISQRYDEGDFDIDSALNYSAIVGGDFGPHSLSVGIFYPVYGIFQGDEAREILATSSSYLFRYMYTNKLARFYAVASIRDKKVSDPKDENIIVEGVTAGSTPSNYEMSSFFLRAGVDFEFPSEIRTGGSLLFMDFDYSQNPNNLGGSLSRLGATAYVRKPFGDYVSFGARATYINDSRKINLTGSRVSRSKNDLVFGFEGALIF